MTLEERVKALEQNLAEACDILRHLTWGLHGDGGGKKGSLHYRGPEIAAKTADQAEMEHPVARQRNLTGRKFR